jgi:hypothetical protein
MNVGDACSGLKTAPHTDCLNHKLSIGLIVAALPLLDLLMP